MSVAAAFQSVEVVTFGFAGNGVDALAPLSAFLGFRGLGWGAHGVVRGTRLGSLSLES